MNPNIVASLHALARNLATMANLADAHCFRNHRRGWKAAARLRWGVADRVLMLEKRDLLGHFRRKARRQFSTGTLEGQRQFRKS